MKTMLNKKIQTKKMGGEFLLNLEAGDLFISFHSEDGNCAGFFCKSKELVNEGLQNFLETSSLEIKKYLNKKENEVEIKIISSEINLKKAYAFFSNGTYKEIKQILKDGNCEVYFLPELNKVRVSKEVAKITRLKVLIVDDSKTIRTILAKIFSTDPIFEVCAMAEKPSEVENLIIKHKPDVITLDIHMPEMDGVTLLKTIIAPKYHIPTIMISSISMAEGPLVLDALENGAIDYIQKPEMSEIEKVTPLILEKVRIAAMSKEKKNLHNDKIIKTQTHEKCNQDSLVVIGSSTGGTEALRDILTALPNEIPPILIVQHIPAVFSLAFAKRMNELCKFEVKEASNGDEVTKNKVLIAPGGTQMKMIHQGGKTFIEINNDEPVNRFKPSVDYFFFTVAKSFYTHTVAVILTGMGKDGARGMLELKKLGARTIAQDEETSVVFGMPREAIQIGAAEYTEPLGKIAEKITLLTTQKKNRKEAS